MPLRTSACAARRKATSSNVETQIILNAVARLFGGLGGLIAVPFDEAINTTFRVNDLLLTGVERVTAAANFNANLLFGGAELYLITANTDGGNLVILRMNTFLHLRPALYMETVMAL